MLHQIHAFTLLRASTDSIDSEGVVMLDYQAIPGQGHAASLSAQERRVAESFAQGATAVLRVPLDFEVRLPDRVQFDTDDWFDGVWEVAACDTTPKHQRIFLRRTETP